ncbi:hypothetical protein [Halobacillus trueperi]|uniref:hypothetical protein n=1 Tax=Halobacillus trueperi TaxID=156205 RepID=UPI0011C040EC|nr:hypothetical protein [Halobacillus trueperi]
MKKVLILLGLILLFGCGAEDTSGAKEEVLTEAEYGEKLKQISSDIINSGATAEEMLNTYSQLWSTAIEREITKEDLQTVIDISVSDMEKYYSYDFYDPLPVAAKGDFNSVIIGTQNFYNGNGKVEELLSASSHIESNLKELNDPPEKFQKVYDETIELYGSYKEFVSLAESPTGSLLEFNKKFSKLSTEIVSSVDKIEVMMPNVN